MNLMKRLGTVTAAATLAIAGLVTVTSGPAAAADDQPCARPQVYKSGHWVQYCPLWKGNVPVYSSPDLGNNQSPIGYLVYGGSSNWFVGDRYRSSYSYQGYYNHWWAYTLADNGSWGWVPEVYFSGGNNDDTDAGLYACDYGLNFNDCP